MPYNVDVLDWLRAEKHSGRRVVLATEGNTNLKSTAKAQALIERFGEGDFDYVSSDRSNL